jgi:predicted NAD/FAD-binding protein
MRWPPASQRPADDAELLQPLGDFLRDNRFSDEFRDWYFLPMIGCIWSCPTDQMLKFPVSTMIRFCHNHGLIQVRRPAAVVDRDRRRAPLCGKNHCPHPRQAP